jgi:superfamily I DNA/RNA helicase
LETYTRDPVSESVARREEEEDVVTLITVHSAKGTEAPVCYVLQVQQGNYPHVRSLGDEHQEEEERRVLYVAMTRAEDELILTRTLQQRGAMVPHGGRTAMHSQNGQACFLDLMPNELMEQEVPNPTPGFDDEAIVPFR